MLQGCFRLNPGFETAYDSRGHCATSNDLVLEDAMGLHALTIDTHLAGHEVLLGRLVADVDDIVCGFRSMWVP